MNKKSTIMKIAGTGANGSKEDYDTALKAPDPGPRISDVSDSVSGPDPCKEMPPGSGSGSRR